MEPKRCGRCGNMFEGFGSYCQRCSDEMAERRRQEREREFAQNSQAFDERIEELDSIALERGLQRVNLFLPSGLLRVGLAEEDHHLFPSSAERKTDGIPIPLLSNILASFELLRKDERFLNISEEYDLHLTRRYAISDLRRALQDSPQDGTLKSYVVVHPPRSKELSVVLRSAAAEACESSTYEGKKVALEDSPITAVLYVKKTSDEKKMLAELLMAIDLLYRMTRDYKAAMVDRRAAIQSRGAVARKWIVAAICIVAVAIIGGAFFVDVSGGTKALVIAATFVGAIIVQAVLRSISRAREGRKLESLQQSLVKEILIKTTTHDHQESVGTDRAQA